MRVREGERAGGRECEKARLRNEVTKFRKAEGRESENYNYEELVSPF